MSAMYRVPEQNWAPDEALEELTQGGFGYHSMWTKILCYVRSMDIAKLRERIELPV